MNILKALLLLLILSLAALGGYGQRLGFELHRIAEGELQGYVDRQREFVTKNEARLDEDVRITSGLSLFAGNSADIGSRLVEKVQIKDSARFAGLASILFSPQWMDHASDTANLGLDFSWMADLKNYDHWALDSLSPLLSDSRKWNFDIGLWTKTRLLKGVREKNLRPALAEVGRLTLILFSTERLKLAALSLVLEVEATEYYQRRVDASFRPDDPVTRLQTRSLFDLIGSGGALLDLATPPDVLKKVYSSHGRAPSLCLELNMRRAALVQERYFLGARLPEGVKAIDALLRTAAASCRIPELRAQWKNPGPLPSGPLPSSVQIPSLPEVPTFQWLAPAFDAVAAVLFPGAGPLPPLMRLFPDLVTIAGLRLPTPATSEGKGLDLYRFLAANYPLAPSPPPIPKTGSAIPPRTHR